MQLDVMCCLDLITSRSWRVGAKLVRDDLGVSITGERRPPRDLERPQARDLVQSSADDSVNCDQYEQQQLQQQQQKTESDELLQDLVTITAGSLLLYERMLVCIFVVIVIVCSHSHISEQCHSGHVQLNCYLSIMGLVTDPSCNQCSVAIESVSHFLWQCDRFTTLWRKVWGNHIYTRQILATQRSGIWRDKEQKKSHRFTQKP